MAGLTGTEPAVIAAVGQRLDPELPGDHVHTVLTLTTDLVHRYRRGAVRVLGNVVPATHGESRDEPIGSGDADAAHQSFALWQHPLTWLPDGGPPRPRAAGSLARGARRRTGPGGAGRRAAVAPGGQPRRARPLERVYVLGTAADGRTTVTFGDGRHGRGCPPGTRTSGPATASAPAPPRTWARTGSRRPSRARWASRASPTRCPRRAARTRRAGHDAAHRSAGGLRAGPAGVGRGLRGLRALAGGHRPAAARRLYDGRRQVLHVTVAGVDDVPLDGDAEVLDALRVSLAAYGDPGCRCGWRYGSWCRWCWRRA
ncbi:hypothetical protein NKH77_40035 [Streptomyces sp. M19]